MIDNRLFNDLKELERIREALTAFAGLPKIESDPLPASLATALHGAGLGRHVKDLHDRSMGVEHGLFRMKSELALCHAYAEASPFANDPGIIKFTDTRWAQQHGIALLLLYSVWSQFAHLLNLLLDWKIPAKDVKPRHIKDKANREAVRGDPWFDGLVRGFDALGSHNMDRHFEAHEMGHVQKVWDLVIDKLGEIRGRPAQEQGVLSREELLQYERETNRSMREQFDLLLDAYRGLPAFVERNLARIGKNLGAP